MEESVDLKRALVNLSLAAEEATSKDEVEIYVFVPLLLCLAI